MIFFVVVEFQKFVFLVLIDPSYNIKFIALLFWFFLDIVRINTLLFFPKDISNFLQ